MQIMTTRFDGNKPVNEKLDLEVNPVFQGMDLYRDVLEAAKEHVLTGHGPLISQLTAFKDPHDGSTVFIGGRVEERDGKYYVHRDDMAAYTDTPPPVSLLNPGDHALDIKGIVLPMGNPEERPTPPPGWMPKPPAKRDMTRGEFIAGTALLAASTIGTISWLLRGSKNEVNHTTFDIPQEHGKAGESQGNNLIREESTQLSEAQKPLYAQLHRIITDGGNPEQMAALKLFLVEGLGPEHDKDQSISHNVIAKAVAYILATSVSKHRGPNEQNQLSEDEKHAVALLDTLIMNMPDEPKDITFITDGKTRKGMDQLAADGWVKNTKVQDEYQIAPNQMVADSIASSMQQRAIELERFKGQHGSAPEHGATIKAEPVTTIQHP